MSGDPEYHLLLLTLKSKNFKTNYKGKRDKERVRFTFAFCFLPGRVGGKEQVILKGITDFIRELANSK